MHHLICTTFVIDYSCLAVPLLSTAQNCNIVFFIARRSYTSHWSRTKSMDWILRDNSFLFVLLHADWILTGNGWMMKVTKMQDVFGLLLKQCFLFCSPQIFFQIYYKQDLGTNFRNIYRTFPAWRMTNCEIGASLRRNRIIWWLCGTPANIRRQSFAKIICNYLTTMCGAEARVATLATIVKTVNTIRQIRSSTIAANLKVDTIKSV